VNLTPAFEQLVGRLEQTRSLKRGAIVVKLTNGEAGYVLESTDGGVRLMRGEIFEPPLVEIIGDARRIESVLAGRGDARALFLAGAFRIRGDLRYFSDLAMELGILKEPL